jgi:hypothetical protein
VNGGNFNIITTQTGCYLPNLADSIFTADRIPPSCQAKICSKMSKSDVKARDWRNINKNCNLVRWHAFWPQKAHFSPYFAHFFDRSAATAYKNQFRLAKNSHFFVSDATTLTSCQEFYTETPNKKLHSDRPPDSILADMGFERIG